MKFKAILLCLTLACCTSTSKVSQDRKIASSSTYDRVLVFGATTQGNGYNWAATVSWLSIKLKDVAEQGQLASDRGERVGIKIANFTGASSGSGVALLFDALMGNKKIMSNSPLSNERIFSIEDINRLSDALLFSAMAFDFHWFFKGSTLYRMAQRNILSVLDRISDLVPFIPDAIGQGRRRMWLSQMNGQVVVSDFAKFVYFASSVSWEQINQKIVWGKGHFKKYSPDQMETTIGQEIASSLTHFHSLPLVEKEALLSENDLKLLRKITKKQSEAARDVLIKNARVEFKKYGKKASLYRTYNAKPKQVKKQSNPYRQVMSSRLGDGVITVTMASRYKNKDEMNELLASEGIPYSKLRPYLFMNEQTATGLLKSKDYQRLIQRKDKYLTRYVVVVIDDKWSAINPSVREPGMLGEYSGEMSSSRFKIKKIYDPRKDHNLQFYLEDIKQETQKNIFVAGGFPFEEMSAIAGSLYFTSQVEDLEKRFKRVQPMYFIFGHPLNESAPAKTFAGRSIKGIFNSSKTPAEANASIQDWVAWSEYFKTEFRYNILPKHNTHLFVTEFNWSTGTLPAAISGTSRILVHNAAAEASKTNIVKKLKSVYSLYPADYKK